jgi:Tfp pilus assembly protein PilN
VGIIGCVIGVATFSSAQVTKAEQNGVFLAKINQCVDGIEEIKKDMKEKNKEVDRVLDEHSTAITQLQTEMKEVFKRLNAK